MSSEDYVKCPIYFRSIGPNVDSPASEGTVVDQIYFKILYIYEYICINFFEDICTGTAYMPNVHYFDNNNTSNGFFFNS